MQRTLIKDCLNHIGETVTIKGWANTIRTHGKINFIDLRDRTGLLQVVGDKSLKSIHPEDVIQVTGQIVNRQEATVNDKIPTGLIELNAESVDVLNPAKTLPFPIDTEGAEIDEELRLKYRYVDLRRPVMQERVKTRSRYVQALREYLFKHDFTEIETPMLTKSTPEGSRDFVVPSRLYPGKFYALPQSPQQYKQLLMTAGFERYFQVARCLRDEDPRADRAYEHTQLDLEMSFVDQDQVMAIVEAMVTHATETIGGNIVQKPFPVITYQEAIAKYGTDKFDLRTEEQKQNGELAFAWVVNFPFFEKDADGHWTFTHNPFSSPIPEHEEWLLNKKNISQIITNQYDLVLNGIEVGGGSIRSHKPEVLQTVFEILGHSQEKIQSQFGHMLQAFKMGTPPHGGCAHGFERLLMAFFNQTSIHEVQAFPQTGRGRTSVMDAPSPLPQEQMAELGLSTAAKEYETPHDHIIDLLNTHKVEYELLKHEPVYTSEDAVKVRGDTTLHQGAKALVLQKDKDLILYVIPGDQRVDFNRLKTFLKAKRVAFASKDTVKAKTGLEVGSIPPLGSTIGLPTFVDQSLAGNQEIAFNAARLDRSIKMKYSDFIKVEKPTVVALQ
jgi:aspartyl-tRNA synthetase